ncbi:hypothetical protein C3432_11305 [Citrobacter amalonaticus]|uniref:Uncharacterized protein n=1 Tax=Citrobacter amalonaticus TaxID=35703 RepID=A0A2S4S0M7_CITAM|nr:hypothetical protein C3432_11305 [Citrobacter amalonaticus]POT76006.1 hypothetical protein C3436_00515 [Citrobacter amalonaticus]POU66995.1 hypothetical protein C3430_09505 [Citrobacter amalonaticus]POV05241.1 hypothetical protein C3424_07820 [Citrobacter amalonaticus]
MEIYTYNGTHTDGTPDTHVVDVYNMGTAITLDQEVDLVIKNNSRVAGITLTQGYEWEDTNDNTVSTGVNSGEVFNNTITVTDSTVTLVHGLMKGLLAGSVITITPAITAVNILLMTWLFL